VGGFVVGQLPAVGTCLVLMKESCVTKKDRSDIARNPNRIKSSGVGPEIPGAARLTILVIGVGFGDEWRLAFFESIKSCAACCCCRYVVLCRTALPSE
jgi:hypothetical protein